ncbi:RrF2 family transcriptional regulator [Truepera radiovictrix]|uniref:Transcriptional regulator, BadM/Rrf2 family n=1 Tax=Truepera radiovictrix (strain DSM 17093 / CIP 108686 / LMG 22925 / RQ-24) TaxID=649638 RepID=D7CVJ1_TRURR|nr:Rrf2 family transcriptional regulator [Truepera radiovictrix]ADI14219.1 transcriptional regulator, BadM/Rrf2 family [Truepera radiovictrix DSM 17093]WMT57223.1 Rrf2 family transcriptional regulator [Truepera radiovictrix]
MISLTQKAKYALKALVFLAKAYGKGPVLIANIAESEGISQKFLELILLELKNHGILQSKKGRGGGYWLNRPPEEIYLGHVIRIFEGALAPLPCASKRYYSRCEECADEATCEVRAVMLEVKKATLGVLDTTSLKDTLAYGQPVPLR